MICVSGPMESLEQWIKVAYLPLQSPFLTVIWDTGTPYCMISLKTFHFHGKEWVRYKYYLASFSYHRAICQNRYEQISIYNLGNITLQILWSVGARAWEFIMAVWIAAISQLATDKRIDKIFVYLYSGTYVLAVSLVHLGLCIIQSKAANRVVHNFLFL